MKIIEELIEKIKKTQAYINYSRILPYAKKYWFRALCACLICIPIGSLDAVIALSLKPYMDIVMIEKSIQASWYIPVVIVAFTSLQGVLNYTADYLNTWVGVLDVINLCPESADETKDFNLFVNNDNDEYSLIALSNTIFSDGTKADR